MSKCAFCQHENPAEAARCANCQAWLFQSADVAKPAPEPDPQEYALDSAEPTDPHEPVSVADRQAFGLAPEDFAAVLQALAAGNKIAAIKRLREATGMGLAEAKQAAEALQRLGGLLGSGDSSQPMVEISQADGVTKIVRRQIIVDRQTLTPELEGLLRQAAARQKVSGCVTRVGALLLAVLGAAACALVAGWAHGG